MHKPLVVGLVFASVGAFATSQPALAKTASYQATDSSTLKRHCALTNGKFGEYTDKAGRHYYWCSGSVNGTIKCVDSVCTVTTADQKRPPPTHAAAGNNNQKLGNARVPAAAANASGNTTLGTTMGVAGSATKNVQSTGQTMAPLGGGAFGASPAMSAPAATASRKLQ
jgi:hypothetical protein